MNALLDPPDRMRGIKWVLVAHTAMMFLFATIFTATTLAMRSIGYIDNREFDGINGRMPGPIGYLWIILNPRAINIISDTMFLFNNWLADGILVGSVLNPGGRIPNLSPSSSSTVALSSTLGTTGPSFSHV